MLTEIGWIKFIKADFTPTGQGLKLLTQGVFKHLNYK